VTPLERALHERITAEGPITVEAYMEACNSYYYATRDPLGAAGDFTTAPEISQMFGELVGAALADCWSQAGKPDEAIYLELGPGRGTLAADALRVMRGAGFSGEVHLVETSPVLRAAQKAVVPDAQSHERLGDIPERPLLLVANEFLDALPVRQHVAGIERHVEVIGGGFAFDRVGEIVEDSPAREAVARDIGMRVRAQGGVALIIDYGHAQTAPGDTLQAVRGHRFASVLESPGEQDLTAHVDFAAISRAARDVGAEVTRVVSQGGWLRSMGIETRADVIARANPQRAEEIVHALNRLTGESEMGALFKVLAIHSPEWPAPAGLQ
jgi:SAM-dependent MidA family methyltransferase